MIKKNLVRTAAVMLVLCFAFTFTACGSESSSKKSSEAEENIDVDDDDEDSDDEDPDDEDPDDEDPDDVDPEDSVSGDGWIAYYDDNQLMVAVDDNPSTGYFWEITGLSGTMDFTGSEFESSVDDDEMIDGAGGVTTYGFECYEEGVGYAVLTLTQPDGEIVGGLEIIGNIDVGDDHLEFVGITVKEFEGEYDGAIDPYVAKEAD